MFSLKKSVTLLAATVAAVGLAGRAQAADIVETAMSAPQFSTLVKAVKAAGLVDTLKGEGPFTVFAPTNAAFAKIPKSKLNALLANKAALKQVLLYHVVAGKKLMASDVTGMSAAANVATAAGSTIRVTPSAMVNNAKIIKTDIEADNGVIHVINTVLMPNTGGGKMHGSRMSKPKM
jgi:uncharacterized surface protein with fasciclin (FAS1) repeats